MNPDDIRKAWNSPREISSPAAREQLAGDFIRRIARRRRFRAIWLTNTIVWLTLAGAAFARTVASGRFDFVREWAAIPLLVLPWMAALVFLRQHLKSSGPSSDRAVPAADSMRIALAATETELAGLKRVALLLVGLAPIVALAVIQLEAVGKVSPREQAGMAVFFGAALAAGLAAVGLRCFRRILPQRNHLRAVLAEMAGD